MDEGGRVLAKQRIAEGVAGVREFRRLVLEHAAEPSQVIVGIETDRGLLVSALRASGYLVYAINPLAASRYRERHVTSRAKSDAGDAKVLADLVRTDRHNHRPIAGDSDLSEALQVLARAHQELIWNQNALSTTSVAACASSTPLPSRRLGPTWPVLMRCPSWRRRPRRRRAAPSPSQRSFPSCEGLAVSATWRRKPPRFNRSCGRRSWRRRRSSRRPMAKRRRRRSASSASSPSRSPSWKRN